MWREKEICLSEMTHNNHKRGKTRGRDGYSTYVSNLNHRLFPKATNKHWGHALLNNNPLASNSESPSCVFYLGYEGQRDRFRFSMFVTWIINGRFNKKKKRVLYNKGAKVFNTNRWPVL